MTKQKQPTKQGYFVKTGRSNRRLLVMFERNQKLRYESKPADWGNGTFLGKLEEEEGQARVEIQEMLVQGKVKTADDFYRAGHFFHHSKDFKDYGLAVALFSVSLFLGERWAKNAYVVALDRFLLAISQKQLFFSQFIKEQGKWKLMPYQKIISDRIRRMYDANNLVIATKMAKKLQKEESDSS